MSAIKDGRLPILLDKERHLLFSLNAIDELQDKFGGFDNLPDLMSGKDGIKNLRWLFTILLNEGGAVTGEPELSEKEVGRLIHTGNLTDIKDAIYRAFAIGVNGDEISEDAAESEGDESETKNTIAGEEK